MTLPDERFLRVAAMADNAVTMAELAEVRLAEIGEGALWADAGMEEVLGRLRAFADTIARRAYGPQAAGGVESAGSYAARTGRHLDRTTFIQAAGLPEPEES